MFTSISVIEPEEIDAGSMARSTHLLKRLYSIPEEGYKDFKNAEETFYDMQPRRLSLLTNRLLASIDYEACRNQRNINFNILHDQLKFLNDLNLDTSSRDGPLCYPLLIDDSTTRERLRVNRIFVPTYWPEVDERVKLGSLENKLLNCCLALPCDHHYSQEDMMRIVDLVMEVP